MGCASSVNPAGATGVGGQGLAQRSSTPPLPLAGRVSAGLAGSSIAPPSAAPMTVAEPAAAVINSITCPAARLQAIHQQDAAARAVEVSAASDLAPADLECLPCQSLPDFGAAPSSVSVAAACPAPCLEPAVAAAAAVQSVPSNRVLQRVSVAECAVSLRFLKRFAASHSLDGLASAEVKDRIVMPATLEKRCRYVEDTGLVSPADVGRPTYFISHTWTGNFSAMVAAISTRLADEIEEEVFVWVDMFAVNQHDFVEDLGNLKDAIRLSSGGTLVMLGDDGAPLRRVWCLYEFANTVLLKGSDSLQMLSDTGIAKLGQMVLDIDVEAAQYTMEEDRSRILGDILLDFGSFVPFNGLLKMLLLLEPLDYSTDLQSLLERAGTLANDSSAVCSAHTHDAGLSPVGSVWDLAPLTSWREVAVTLPLLRRQVDGTRSGRTLNRPAAVVVSGGAGEGKSTLAALLVAGAGALQRHEPAAKRAAAAAHSTSTSPDFPVHAWHFFKSSDAKRQDVVRIIKTLAYQLATCPELPELQSVYLRRIQDGHLQPQQLTDMTSAFEVLLHAPLKEYAETPGHQPLVIVFDALDESDTTSMAFSSNKDPILQLLCKQFATLSGVTFVLTIRSGMEYLNVVSGLRTAFQLTELQAGELHVPEQLQQHIKRRLLDDFNRTGTAPWRPADEAEATAVAGHLLLLSRPPAATAATFDGGSAAEAPDPVAGTAPPLAESDVSAQAHNMIYLTVCTELLLQGLVTPSSLPTTLLAAYSCAFAGVPGDLGQAETASVSRNSGTLASQPSQRTVKDLLAVLVAAREPLSPSQLRSLQLDHLRPLLPLNGALFFERDMRMHLLHKSLSEYLAGFGQDRVNIDVQAGHLYLAQASNAFLTQHRFVGSSDGHRVLSGSPTLVTAAGAFLGNPYGLRHVVAHSCLSCDAATLTRVLLDIDLWEAIYAAGFGPAVIGDLVQLSDGVPIESKPLVEDVLRWLRSCSVVLVQHPRAAWQLARDSPHSSLIAKHAADQSEPHTARLLFKDELWSACLTTLRQHAGGVMCVAISPDGKTIVSGSIDSTLRVWDFASGDCITTLVGHTSEVTCVAISPDGQIIASGSKDDDMRVWDLQSGQCSLTIDPNMDWPASVVITPNNMNIVSGAYDGSVRLWDLGSGLCLRTLRGHVGAVLSLVISADGNTVVSGAEDKTVRMWRIKYSYTGEAGASDVSGDAVGDIPKVEYKDDEYIPWSGNDSGYSEDYRDLNAGASSDNSNNEDHTDDDDKDDDPTILVGHTERITCVALSRDGSTIFSGSTDQSVRTWDKASGKLKDTKQLTSAVTSLAVSADGKTLVAGAYDNTIRVWDLADGSNERTLLGHTSMVTQVVLSPDGHSLVSCSHDRSVRVWSLLPGLSDGTSDNHTSIIHSVAASSDGLWVVSGSQDRTLRVWDLQSGQCTHVLRGHTESVTSVAVTHDCTVIVSGSCDGTMRAWNSVSGECVHIFSPPLDERDYGQKDARGILTVAVTRDGQKLLAGVWDGTIRIWSMSGTCLSILSKHTHEVRSISLSPDGLHMVSTSHDFTIRLWDLLSGQCLRVIKTNQDFANAGCPCRVTISPDGSTIALEMGRKVLRRWELGTGQLLDDMVGRAAEDQLKAVHAWRYPSTNRRNVTVQSSNLGVVDILPIHGGDHSPPVATVFVLPPFVASHDCGLHLSPDEHRVAFFDRKSGRFLQYDLKY